jgi:hypothetical protein
MAAVANIVVADGAVNRTFIPVGFDKLGAFWWEEVDVAASAIGNARISGQLLRAGNPSQGASSLNRVSRVKWTLHYPGLETLGVTDGGLQAPPTLAYVDRFSSESILSERGTSSLRGKGRTMFRNLMADAAYSGMVDTFANVY